MTSPSAARAVLSLGSNQGDRRALLAAAVDELGDAVVATSSLYSTPPWGGVEQADFLNAVVLVHDDTATDPYHWLRRCQELEQRAGRQRSVRWGPRTLDVDVIVVGEWVLTDPTLTVPHPFAHERAFVLLPWAEVEPTAILPGHGPIAELLAGLDDDQITPVGTLR